MELALIIETNFFSELNSRNDRIVRQDNLHLAQISIVPTIPLLFFGVAIFLECSLGIKVVDPYLVRFKLERRL